MISYLAVRRFEHSVAPPHKCVLALSSDPERRKLYDETGEVSEDLAGADFDDLKVGGAAMPVCAEARPRLGRRISPEPQACRLSTVWHACRPVRELRSRRLCGDVEQAGGNDALLRTLLHAHEQAYFRTRVNEVTPEILDNFYVSAALHLRDHTNSVRERRRARALHHRAVLVYTHTCALCVIP
eukprot:363362-Chlamydomonas_euryale.AAC.5